jgi:hypothetical protein
MKFSQRIGKTSVRDRMQIDSIDQVLENKLWNDILMYFINEISSYQSGNRESQLGEVYIHIWINFFERKIDELQTNTYGIVRIEEFTKYIKGWFVKANWYEKYDFIEFILPVAKQLSLDFNEKVAHTLKNELSGFTILNNKIIQITSDVEVSSIENALKNTSEFSSVEEHLNQSIELLSNREHPDYRNSIKESISAVEAYCTILTKDKKATLGKALSQIEKSHNLHPALKSAFSSIYGYTSDSSGIRHALIEDDIETTQEDAKFMLVACSAFINYLRSKL